MVRKEKEEVNWQAIIGRSLAYLSLHMAGLKDENLSMQYKFLTSLGLDKEDSAMILNTTPETLRVSLYSKSKKKGDNSNGKVLKKRH